MFLWNDDIDISCDELWANGEEIDTPFDGLMAFSDATFLWNLNESSLRKAITYGKLVNGVDVCKFGKQRGGVDGGHERGIRSAGKAIKHMKDV